MAIRKKMDKSLKKNATCSVGSERRPVLNRLLLPGPTKEYDAFQERYGDASVVPTRTFLYGLEPGEELAVDLEPGVRLYIRLEAITETDEYGIRTLMVTVNGQARPIDAQDRSLKSEVPVREKAEPGDDRQVAAPMTGVVTISADEGDEVSTGQQIATIEAMKMESAISAPKDGTVERVAVTSGTNVEPGDLLLVLG